jgi:succinate dehydrogenase / fumarate reductase flavoprotein subunit
MLEAKIPSGPIERQWDKCRFEMKLVNPANRRKHSIIIVGAGLAGAAAAATLGQQGYHVHCFSYHDTPRRAHSIAAQGGINAAKNYRNDGDSISPLPKTTPPPFAIFTHPRGAVFLRSVVEHGMLADGLLGATPIRCGF